MNPPSGPGPRRPPHAQPQLTPRTPGGRGQARRSRPRTAPPKRAVVEGAGPSSQNEVELGELLWHWIISPVLGP
ncbi:hypothetical protein VULLAG_LOCUS4705 [Vulpes lagopus]